VVCLVWAEWIINPLPFQKTFQSKKARPAQPGGLSGRDALPTPQSLRRGCIKDHALPLTGGRHSPAGC
jgi:hypothetical protein